MCIRDSNWTASDNFSIIGSHVYTVKTGDGWLAASLPDGSSERKFLFTVKELSRVDLSLIHIYRASMPVASSASSRPTRQ